MDFFENISLFMEKGGQILWLIFATLFLLWFFILEKYYFFKYIYPDFFKKQQAVWHKMSNKNDWTARAVRQKMISETSRTLHKSLSTINTLIVLFPLLGLLGTIVGMIAIFDIMSFAGTGNARLMASGISMAVIPTMSGMVAAISGIYFSTHFQKKAKHEVQKFQEALSLD